MRVLITGGAGFVGSHLTDALLARGDQVLVLDDLSTGRHDNIRHHIGDMQALLQAEAAAAAAGAAQQQ